MKINFLSVLKCVVLPVLLFSNNTFAQSIHEEIDVREWPDGLVMLTTGDSLRGAITYHNKEDVINVTKEDGTISSFSPVNVRYFIVTNSYTGLKQVFRSLYWNLGKENSDFKKPTFFEQLNKGKYTLIMRETFVVRSPNGLEDLSSSGGAYATRTLVNGSYVDQARPQYFILMPDGEIKSLKRVRKDFLKLCGDKASQLRQYAKTNSLSFELPNEFTAIVDYYNTL